MKTLNYQLKQLCKTNRDGSYGTQVQRERLLTLIANQLEDLGFRQLQAKSLRPKHIEALTQHWLETGVAAGTMKNRMAAIRWWADKVNKQNVVARSNDHYGLPRRQYVNGASRAKELTGEQIEQIKDPHIQMSLRLQAAFGLRREEAIKIRPQIADKDGQLWLKPSWTKGGRERYLPILTRAQRDLLEDAKRLAGAGSLIPADKTYVQQLKRYEGLTLRAGLNKMHGLRHAYAQARYQQLAGFDAPLAGGPSNKQLNDHQRIRDQLARQMISNELGHRREAITTVYLGR